MTPPVGTAGRASARRQTQQRLPGCRPQATPRARRRGFAAILFPLLNIVQTVPSIALFGLLLAPLSALAHRFLWRDRVMDRQPGHRFIKAI